MTNYIRPTSAVTDARCDLFAAEPERLHHVRGVSHPAWMLRIRHLDHSQQAFTRHQRTGSSMSLHNIKMNMIAFVTLELCHL